MPDETKSPSSPPPEGQPKPAADQPAAAGEARATSPGPAAPETKAAPERPAAPATPPKPAPGAPAAAKPAAPAPGAGHPAPPKPAGPVPTPWQSPMVARFKREHGSGVEAWTHLGQNYMVVDRSLIPEILQILRNDEQFDYCVDITAVHYPA